WSENFNNYAVSDKLEIVWDCSLDSEGNIVMPTNDINIYVDGVQTKTLSFDLETNTYTLVESDMPLDYESCCGYFFDEELTKTSKNDIVDLSNGDVNIYTRTADPSLFSFSTDGADGYIITKNSAVTYSGTEFNLVMPREYDGKTVTTIANYAFSDVFGGCSLVNIVFSSEINTISYQCFDTDDTYSCNIGEMNLHNNITHIGDRAFCCCLGIGELVLSNSIISIGNEAFRRCSELVGDLVIPDTVISIGDSTFSGCGGFDGSLTIGESVKSIGAGAFSGCEGFVGRLIIPNSVTSIGADAFNSCRGLTGSLSIPNSVTNIGNSAFNGCNGLTSVTIGDSVTSIGESAFTYCGGLTSVTIGNGVTSIGNYAFYCCRSLTSVYIPSSVTTISASGYYDTPFSNCSSSLVIYTDVTNASSVPSGWSQYWNYYSSSGTLTVNYGYTLEQYKSAVGLTFAPNGESLDDGNLEIDNHIYNMNIETNYLEEIVLKDKEEFIIVDRRQVC
ncbi:MAG: leucine-rich repeat domain-containing protein, partial [Clostridia bacterium]|nr:leucine-rich repeat domain-containing protein [Clostridia bacterium]